MRESIISLGVILAFTPWGWGQAIDRQVLDQIQDATVFVKLAVPQVGEGSGSGFVIVDTTGKFEVKAKFTMAPDYARSVWPWIPAPC